MSEGFIKKFKGWMSIYEPQVDVDDEDNIDEEEPNEEEEPKLESNNPQLARNTSKVVNLHTNGQMKVVISQPKKYDDVTVIADHLRQRKAVIVNLESVEEDPQLKKSIYFFISGAVYMLDGSMRRVSKSIYILAPNNVDIDPNTKKELESKAFFPWNK